MRDRIDTIDVQLLEILQEDARATLGRMGEAVDLAESTVSERVRRLEELGVITGYHARVDGEKVRRDILAYVRLFAGPSEHYEQIVGTLRPVGGVLALHTITGEGSHLLKVSTRDTTGLERLLSRIQEIPGVHETTTSVVLTTHKDTTALELEPCEAR